jgi:hypothetical protein
MYGYLHDLKGTGARTFAPIPKQDWCRFAFIVNEYFVIYNLHENLTSIFFLCLQWSIYINCLQTWDQPIKAVQ